MLVEEEKNLLLLLYEGGNHNSVLLWPGYPPACKTKTSGLRSSDHISQLAKKLPGLMKGTQNVPRQRKNNLPMNITMNWLLKITRRNPVDSALLVQVAVAFSTSCRGWPLMVLWMRTSRNTVESHILHSLTRKTKVIEGICWKIRQQALTQNVNFTWGLKEVCSSLLHYS